jgi:nucleoside-diphosphate-sugar epimerase
VSRSSAKGADVRGLELNADAADRVEGSGAAFELCDVVDRAALDRSLAGADAVVHTAAHVREWGDIDDFVREHTKAAGASPPHGGWSFDSEQERESKDIV